MKKLLHFIMAFLLLAAFGVGCSRGGGEAGLVAIDSLIAASPDSALAALGRIDTAALGEGGRAYHALLTVQARFLAGHSATDSAGICRAWRWYAHHGPTDRQLRAMRYRARTAEEMGDPETAMRWYKRTELAAREQGDDLAAAYALMSMGILYQENLESRHAVDKYRQTDSMLNGSDPECQWFCRQQLSQLYMDDAVDADSAMHFILAVREWAFETGDTTALALNSETLVKKLFYDSSFVAAKDSAVSSIRRFGDRIPATCWLRASQSYAFLGMVDSAEYYYSHSPAPATPADSMMQAYSLALVNGLHGRWQDALRMENVSDGISDNIIRQARSTALIDAENAVTAEQAKERENRRDKGFHVLWGAVAILAAAASMALRRARRKRAELEETINQKIEEIGTLKRNLTALDGSINLTDTKADFQYTVTDNNANTEYTVTNTILDTEHAETVADTGTDTGESATGTGTEIPAAIAVSEDGTTCADNPDVEHSHRCENLRNYVRKVNDLISASLSSISNDDMARLLEAAKMDADQQAFWLSDESLELLDAGSRALFRDIASRCSLSGNEVIVLKMVALDFSDNEIRVLLGKNSESYIRVCLKRIREKAGLGYNIRKAFRLSPNGSG